MNLWIFVIYEISVSFRVLFKEKFQKLHNVWELQDFKNSTMCGNKNANELMR